MAWPNRSWAIAAQQRRVGALRRGRLPGRYRRVRTCEGCRDPLGYSPSRNGVISGHWSGDQGCPLYPRKQTCPSSKSMSALCQERTSRGHGYGEGNSAPCVEDRVRQGRSAISARCERRLAHFLIHRFSSDAQPHSATLPLHQLGLRYMHVAAIVRFGSCSCAGHCSPIHTVRSICDTPPRNAFSQLR